MRAILNERCGDRPTLVPQCLARGLVEPRRVEAVAVVEGERVTKRITERRIAKPADPRGERFARGARAVAARERALDLVDLGIAADSASLSSRGRGRRRGALHARKAPGEDAEQDHQHGDARDAELERSALRPAEAGPADEIGEALPQRRTLVLGCEPGGRRRVEVDPGAVDVGTGPRVRVARAYQVRRLELAVLIDREAGCVARRHAGRAQE